MLLLVFLLLLLLRNLLKVVAAAQIIGGVVYRIQFGLMAVDASDGQVMVGRAGAFSIFMGNGALHAAIVEVALAGGMMESLTSMALYGCRFLHLFDSNSAVSDGVDVEQSLVIYMSGQ